MNRLCRTLLLLLTITMLIAGCGASKEEQIAEQLSLGQKYLLEQDYEQAVVAFNKVIKLDPQQIEAYEGLMDAYSASGNYADAVTTYEKGLAYAQEQDDADVFLGYEAYQDQLESALLAVMNSAEDLDTQIRYITLLTTLCPDDEEYAAERVTLEEAQANGETEVVALQKASIQETVILDDENITAVVTGIDYFYAYPMVTMTITNNRSSGLTVQPRFAVNGCMTGHGNYYGDAISIHSGESSNYAFFLYDNEYYGIYPEESPIRSLDVAVHIEGDGDVLYTLDGEQLTGDELDTTEDLLQIQRKGLRNSPELWMVQPDEYIYVPGICYESEYVHIDTDLADASTGSIAAPDTATALLNEAGCSLQFIELIQTLDGSYAYVLYAENTNNSAYTILCTNVSVNGTALSAHSSQFYGMDGSDFQEWYYDNAAYPYSVPLYITNVDQRVSNGYGVPYAALTLAPGASAYLILPLDKDGLAIDGVSTSFTTADVEFSIASADSEPVLCTATIHADSAQAEPRSVDITQVSVESGLSTWIRNSTAYDYNLLDQIYVKEADDTDTAFLAAALKDIAEIDPDTLDLSACQSYHYAATDGLYVQGPGYDSGQDPVVHDGYARDWFLDLYPSAEYDTAFSDEFLSGLKQVLLDHGYTVSNDTWYEQITNDGCIRMRISIYDSGRNISIYASPVEYLSIDIGY